ncbi:helix-turn-helix transcriptional regulator [Nocardiopsis sp. CT-R113]|uniref:Helix-turn-helix transcriptional regulator n=1 Tax=Nocardiopsis codii TaxID=3065942 RepID=A0ABU7KEV7_9ACTN|nr:helix-turn-helix transcriptional regulator [Nocardiopsis sp. CT-R113]MEE2040764.1 helix-turn-helix transcriptional regulator [Nocardiopsis sp. CT-R113]
MANALATCDMATILEGVRTAHGWSQGELARAIDYSQSWVSRVVNGQQALTVNQVQVLAQRLDVPLHLLRFGGAPPPGGPVRQEVDTTRHRGPGRAVSAGAVLTTAPPPSLAPAPSRSGAHHSVNETTAPALRSITGGQRRMDATSPARHLLPSAVTHVHLAEQMLTNSRGTPFHPELSAAASEASGFAAWLHADQGDMGSARMHYRSAVVRARQAGMRLLDVYMLGSLAAFEIDTADDPELGLGLVREAEHVLGPSAHPTAHAWLACVGALAHAGIGDRSAAGRAIGRAEKEVARTSNTDPPWPWVFAFDQAKVAGYRALVGVRLRSPHDAREAFAEAFAPQAANAKQSAVLQVELASAHAEAGDVDEAFRLAREALTTGVRFASERVIGRVRMFRRRYRGPRAGCVEALDRELASLLTTIAASGWGSGKETTRESP